MHRMFNLATLWRSLGIAVAALALAFMAPVCASAAPASGLTANSRAGVLAEEEPDEPEDDDEEDAEEGAPGGESDDDDGKKKRWFIIGGSVGGASLVATLTLWYRRAKRVHTAYKVGRKGYSLYRRHRDRDRGDDSTNTQPPHQ